ncbi:cytochrome [Burkholderia cenocepacia]|nr:cytochrome [Burkholderia cenocepacia]
MLKYADLASPEFYRNPYPLYQQLRAAGPLVPIAPNTFITGRADIVRAVLVERKLGRGYLEAIASRYGEEGAKAPVFQAISRMMMLWNPPMHTRVRALLMKAFNARQIEGMREMTQQVADDLIDALPIDRPFDLVEGLTTPMPLTIICRLMGIRMEDTPMLGAETAKIVQALEAAPLNEQKLHEANTATIKVEDYFAKLVEERRQTPGDDLISKLLSVNDNGDTLTEEEIISNVLLMFVAGFETTGGMMGNALIALHQHPEQLAKLRANPALISSAVSECMRYDSSVHAVQRTALEDVEVAGIQLKKGTLVMLSLGAANRDPAQYEDPDAFLIERPDSGMPLWFAGGIHYCMGARLAMMELEIAINTLLARFPMMQLTNLDSFEYQTRNTVRGVKSIMATV